MMRVLVTHYDSDRLSSLAESLKAEDENLNIFEAQDGVDALSQMEETEFDIVILSAVLPKKLGFDVCRQIKSNAKWRAIPVILITDSDDGYGRGKARQAGADLVVAEPLERGAILKILDSPNSSGDPLDLSKAGSRSHHERLLASILKEGGAQRDSMLARFSDPVTGLYDRQYIRLRIEDEFKKSRRYGAPLSLVLAEVDNYDEIVAIHGPSAGDMTVVEVASVFLCESRDIDIAGRLDKARFVFLLPNTDMAGARIMADRVFNELLTRTIHTGDAEVQLTISVGIANCPRESITTVDEFLDVGVKGLTTASKNGGNKICVWGDS